MEVASFSGLASGIQWRDMVDQIIRLESRRIDRITAQTTAIRARATAWNTFRARVQTVESAARALDRTRLLARQVSITHGAVRPLLAHATEATPPGSYGVSVLAVATREKLAGDSFADRTAARGLSGELLINGRRIEIGADDSLERIAARINESNSGSSPAGVTAAVSATADGSYRLLLTATETGARGIRLADVSGGVLRGLGLIDNATAVRSQSGGVAVGEWFGSSTSTVAAQLGLASAPAGTVTINGQAIAIDLAVDSLDDIAARIDQPAGPVRARVVVDSAQGNDTYRLEISGTTAFSDSGNVLETLGILAATRTSAAQEISTPAYRTTSNAVATGATSLAELSLDGTAPLLQAGDTLQLRGSRPDGSTYSLSLAATATLDDLVSALNSSSALRASGAATATATLDPTGRLIVRDDAAQDSLLALEATVISATGEVRSTGIGSLTVNAGRTRVLTAAQDARLRVDGTYVTRSSNTITDVIAGVTLNLSAVGDATIDVTRDTGTAAEAIRALVNGFNALSEFVAQQSTVPTGGTPPPLHADAVLRGMRTNLRAALDARVQPQIAGGITRLADLGIEVDRYGRYTTDDVRLNAALNTRADEVARFFGVHAQSSTSALSLLRSSDATRSGTYAVSVAQVATRAVVTGSVDAGTTVNAGDRLVVRDLSSGRNYSVGLHGRTIDELAVDLQQELLTAQARRLTSGSGAAAGGATSLTAAGAGISDGDRLTISGTRANGTAFLYRLDVGATDTLDSLAALIETQLDGEASVLWNGTGFDVTSRTTGSNALSLAIRNETAASDPFGSFQASVQGRGAARITASASNGTITLQHADYGSAAGFELWYEDAAGAAKGAGYDALTLLTGAPASPGTHRGVDVAGTIDGLSATGSGRTLTANSGNANGLSLQYTGTAPGSGTIDFSRGIGSLLELTAKALLGSGSGSITAVTSALDDRVQTLHERADTMTERLEVRRAELVRRFTALEQVMARAQSQSAWLAAQITRLENSGKK